MKHLSRQGGCGGMVSLLFIGILVVGIFTLVI